MSKVIEGGEGAHHLPALAEERESEALDLAHQIFILSRKLVQTGMLMPIGYRVMVKPHDAVKTLEEAQAQQFPELAERGFEQQTEQERKRRSKGENHGVVMGMGKMAYNRLGGREMWCDMGDTILFARYNGMFIEHPPESGNIYQFINDEDVYGRYE